MYGRPGSVYIDIPGNLVLSSIDEDQLPKAAKVALPPPVSIPPLQIIRNAIDVIKNAHKPLVIVGKGQRKIPFNQMKCEDDIILAKIPRHNALLDVIVACLEGLDQHDVSGAAWSERGPTMVQQFLTKSGLPWLATPGGKGICTDNHPRFIILIQLSVAPARSFALRESDCVLLIGARLNWMLHFGHPPRFDKDVKIIQIDITGEEFHQNVPTTVPLLGDVGETLDTIISHLNEWKFPDDNKWMIDLRKNAEKNRSVVELMASDHSIPLNYYAAYTPIRDYLSKNDVLVVNEGANTMDIGRTMMPSVLPRRRLDAGTFGDYNRMFSYRLPVVTVVLNNSGIYRGMSPEDMKAMDGDPTLVYPVLSLSAECRYDELCKALGGNGYFVRSVPELKRALSLAFDKKDGPSLINVIISTDSERKAQAHAWLTRSKV
ncbi:thiamine pyrophosphate enzyme, central domain protein [Dictyocaulus viviparus]|uniref:2-hydroxyacyl-CoA lyase n=1 Tax=Dictyocaulus viviparus TaxID=29172 RepID=A0A0D8XNF5_DICVI|nr:thiamine pyrophosphate enzyme, central domain protein [Dictyocaulus viviparus]